jgi:hypothetical protein
VGNRRVELRCPKEDQSAPKPKGQSKPWPEKAKRMAEKKNDFFDLRH